MESMVEKKDVVIIGAGVAGLAASYYLKQAGIKSVIYEGSSSPGGLSKSFTIGDYYFDYGGHCTFTKEKEIRDILETGVACHESIVIPYNYKKEKWIKHPVQNNLYCLSSDEKIAILEDFINRPNYVQLQNYQEWLQEAYGDYYTKNYPKLYTRKYWTVDPEQLETRWVGPRMYQSNLHEVLKGAFELDTPNVHYSGGIRYPKNGGFEIFLKNMINHSDILCNKQVVKIDPDHKIIEFSDCMSVTYQILISTIALPEYRRLLSKTNDKQKEAMRHLNYTSLTLVSFGLKKVGDIPATMFYIYDEEILPARVYSTSVMSGKGREHISLQAEVYSSKFKPLQLSLEEVKEQTIKQLIGMHVFEEEDIEVSDVRHEKYANIIFTHDIYNNRACVHELLKENNIYYAGRFGEWDYLWTDQSMLSGKKAAMQVIEALK